MSMPHDERAERAKDAMRLYDQEQRERLDVQQAFLIYAAFAGDIDKVAASLNVRAQAVIAMEEAGDWKVKLQTLLKLKGSKQGKEVDRVMNRANNFVLAHRMRLTLERVVRRLDEMTDEQLFDSFWCETTRQKKDGTISTEKRLNFRGLADLATALDKVQMLSYAALNDTAGERTLRGKTELAKNAEPLVDVHATIAEAMAKANRQSSLVGHEPGEPTPGAEPR